MDNFVFYNPTKIIFGSGSIKYLSGNLEGFGKRILLVYGKGSIKNNGIYNDVINNLKDFKVFEFSGIEQNPRVETIRKCLEQYKNNKPDFILAVGGGSVIDACKLLASSFYYDGDPWDFVENTKSEPSKYIPLGVVLTVSATGSEMNSGAVISNHKLNLKHFFKKQSNFPKFSILDPNYIKTCSKNQTAYGIIDIFSHVLEQYLTNSKNALIQDRFCEGIMLTIKEISLPLLKNLNDYELRSTFMYSAMMALNGILRTGIIEDWATHAIEHQLSAYYDIPHGLGLGIITPRWMKEIYMTKLSKFVQYGKRIWGLSGSDDNIALKSIEATYKFFNSLGISMKLSELNINDEYFDIISTKLENNKIGEFSLNKKQILNILNNSL